MSGMTRTPLEQPVRVAVLIGLVMLGLVATAPVALSQSTSNQPFILPFKGPPGPGTWLLGQPYGNTVFAFQHRTSFYGASQGIHFGTDFVARCGTEVLSIADGVVFAVDDLSFGSGPHNLMIDHPKLGYATLYGHLLKRPALQAGQAVKAGEVVALSGDPAGTCTARPHLHLEVRGLEHVRKYDPVPLIQADWDNLALTGPPTQIFERNLDRPRQWQYLNDQPEATIGGPLLNDFAHPWPPDWTGP